MDKRSGQVSKEIVGHIQGLVGRSLYWHLVLHLKGHLVGEMRDDLHGYRKVGVGEADILFGGMYLEFYVHLFIKT